MTMHKIDSYVSDKVLTDSITHWFCTFGTRISTRLLTSAQMIFAGAGCRLQICSCLATEWFNSTFWATKIKTVQIFNFFVFHFPSSHTRMLSSTTAAWFCTRFYFFCKIQRQMIIRASKPIIIEGFQLSYLSFPLLALVAAKWILLWYLPVRRRYSSGLHLDHRLLEPGPECLAAMIRQAFEG